MDWIQEVPAKWDDDKQKLIKEGAFNLGSPAIGGELNGKWYRMQIEGGAVIGYGWITESGGDAEISVAVAEEHKGNGLGGRIIDKLCEEAAGMGYISVTAVVCNENPDAKRLMEFLYKRGFTGTWPGLGELDLSRACGLVQRASVTLNKTIG